MDGQLLVFVLLLGWTPVRADFEYAMACLPKAFDLDLEECYVNIVSSTTAKISLHTVFGDVPITLPPDTLHQANFGGFQPSSGVDNRAIRITSDVEIQVVVHKHGGYFNDAIMVPNQKRSDNVNNLYFTTAYPAAEDGCGSDYTEEFYLVSSFYDDTFVNVTQQNGATYEVELPAFGTFQQMTTDAADNLASGTKISSSKPINVISGNACAMNDGGEGTFASNIPEVASLGMKYVVPMITSGESHFAGYSVSVVATEDNTRVESEGDVEILNEGETAIFEYGGFSRSVIVECSKTCLVSQYSKSGSNIGLFMLHTLPEFEFGTYAYFTTLTVIPPSYLSLVIWGEEAAEDLYLNGVSLGDLTWTPIDGYAWAEISLTSGEQELVSADGRPVAAYFYNHAASDHGAGYTILTEGVGKPDTTPPPLTTEPSTTAPPDTTPPPLTTEPTNTAPPVSTPEPSDAYPQHTARVNGTAHATDGQDISPSCAMEHLLNLDEKTKEMVVVVNQEIGRSICLHIPDILVVTDKAALYLEGNQMPLTIDHTLRAKGHHVVDDVVACAVEVAEFLNVLPNWEQPIFPDVSGCSRIEVRPSHFNTSGTLWNCDNQTEKDDTDEPLNYLAYESKVSEVLSTADGSIIDSGCAHAYSDEAATKTSSMLGEITDAIEESGCSDTVISATYAESFIAGGSEAVFLASFYYTPVGSTTFDEFLTCMQLVHAFSLEHENWSPGSQPGEPFLPVPPGCPALEHEGPTLDDEGRKWTCVEGQ